MELQLTDFKLMMERKKTQIEQKSTRLNEDYRTKQLEFEKYDGVKTMLERDEEHLNEKIAQ